jgi:hypothetical protein
MKSLALIISVVVIPIIFMTVLASQLPERGDGQNIPTVRQEYINMR